MRGSKRQGVSKKKATSDRLTRLSFSSDAQAKLLGPCLAFLGRGHRRCRPDQGVLTEAFLTEAFLAAFLAAFFGAAFFGAAFFTAFLAAFFTAFFAAFFGAAFLVAAFFTAAFLATLFLREKEVGWRVQVIHDLAIRNHRPRTTTLKNEPNRIAEHIHVIGTSIDSVRKLPITLRDSNN